MIDRLQHVFALSEKGARDFVKAVLWCFVCNISLMLPVGVIMATIQYLLNVLENGENTMDRWWVYTGMALLVLAVLFILHYFQYAALYLATYQESASRRVSLAETLRKLPLSFFGNRDLSDLTATMISDCSSLDQMFSHYIPQLLRVDLLHAVYRYLHVLFRLEDGGGRALGIAGGGASDGGVL